MSGGLRAALQNGMGSSLRLVKQGAPRLSLVAALVFGASPVFAQQYDEVHPYTIHVYTNLMEAPALVLDTSLQPLKHVDMSRFVISLDSGPKFPPSYVRLEGDDPISLSVFLDLSDEDMYRALPILRKTIPELAPSSLHPADHISLYALDCTLVRSAEDLPASRDAIAQTLEAALEHPGLHGQKSKPAHCGGKNRLWDSLGGAAKDLSSQPGRRVILLISNGHESRSHLRMDDLRRFSATRGIAIFGLTYGLDTSFDPFTEVYPLETLCNSTGGTVLHLSSERDLSNAVSNVLKMVRGRYILQFHRPGNATEGLHNVEVTLKHTAANIRVAGTTVPLPSPEERTGPDGLPPNPTTSVIGTRHPLSPQ